MIEMHKKYRYRNGEPARVLCVDRPGVGYKNHPVLSVSDDGYVTPHAKDGAAPPGNSESDLIEISEWDDCPVDEKIWVRSENSYIWHRMHFAERTEDGRIWTWPEGRTSHTTTGYIKYWWVNATRTKPEGV